MNSCKFIMWLLIEAGCFVVRMWCSHASAYRLLVGLKRLGDKHFIWSVVYIRNIQFTSCFYDGLIGPHIIIRTLRYIKTASPLPIKRCYRMKNGVLVGNGGGRTLLSVRGGWGLSPAFRKWFPSVPFKALEANLTPHRSPVGLDSCS